MAKLKLTNLLILLMILKVKLFNCDISQVSCVMNRSNTKCSIFNLTVTSKNYTFVPVAPDSRVVINFEMVKSIVSVLTSNICTTFTKLYSFTAINQHIEIVEDYAFNNCTEIIYINLERNSIHQLGTGCFSNTKKLQRLRILGGSLPHIDIDLFSNLGELKQLLFGDIGLKEVSMEAVKNLKKLESLYLYSNDLADLDAAGLVENLVSLKSVYINDNNFHCDRLIEIIDIFEARKIEITDYSFWTHLKKRDYIPRKVRNIICLSQAQLEAEKLKKKLAASLDELKDLPLGKEIIELKAVVEAGFINSDSVIVNLSSIVNETSQNLNAQISNLNGTLRNTSTDINATVSRLRQEILANQKNFEEKLNTTMVKLRKLDESNASLMDKYNVLWTNMSSSDLSYQSLSHNMIIYWVCLTSLLLLILALVFYIKKKFRNIYVPFLCYKDRVF